MHFNDPRKWPSAPPHPFSRYLFCFDIVLDGAKGGDPLELLMHAQGGLATILRRPVQMRIGEDRIRFVVAPSSEEGVPVGALQFTRECFPGRKITVETARELCTRPPWERMAPDAL